ncbi:MAG: N-acetylmuramoyl-L-alanine amidase [Clostridia bacterium]|jgi:N-acetylmuramoyl-L-alanine amidase|nr:N-acetylmuramoyl-L-alanine amidase [Clostridia bacterium]MCI2015533.1 N-acetylmuramoyl-L-alanine amidase [Clostridia bacterium]
MPKVYLSPSAQEYNPYPNGGNEEYYMNLIADAIEPYLEASGIEFVRNNPNDTLSQTISNSNREDVDLHVAIHSNAAGENLKGKLSGTDIYYNPVSVNGLKFAEILQNNFKTIYPNPDKVNLMPTTSLAEIRRTVAPSVLIETAYHDNPEDEQWIKDNIQNIARVIAESITEYFGMPFVEPMISSQDYETNSII